MVLAGAKTVEALREREYTGPLTLVGSEPHLPYERPPLSKDHLLKQTPLADFTPHDAQWYADRHVTLRLGSPAASIDLAAHTVTLTDGEELGYTGLALATGSRPRVPHLRGAETALLLRTIDDSDALDAAIGEGTRVAVIGGGWIGLETTAAARERGAEVTVLEVADQPLLGVMGSRVGAAFAELHRRHGVDLRTGVSIDQITTEDDRATGVLLTDGTHLPADVVVAGIGAAPNVELAAEAGLATDDGVVVDAALRTSDPDVVAVGDIAAHDHPGFDGRVRVEHWANALHQPAVAAASLLGEPATYDRPPYFFSDQFDLGMEYRGLASNPEDVVVRGDLAGAYLAFWLSDDRVEAAMNVNIWDAGDDLAALVKDRVRVDRGRLADPQVPLTDVTAGS